MTLNLPNHGKQSWFSGSHRQEHPCAPRLLLPIVKQLLSCFLLLCECPAVQERGKTAGLRPPSFQGLRNEFQEGAWCSLTDERGSLSLHHLCVSVVHAEHLLSFWESGIWARVRQRPHDYPITTLGPESLTGFLDGQQFLCAVSAVAERIQCIFCSSPIPGHTWVNPYPTTK